MQFQRLLPCVMLVITLISGVAYGGAKDPKKCAALLTEATIWQYVSKVAIGDYGLIREIISSKLLDQPELRSRKEKVGEGAALLLETQKGREFYLVDFDGNEALIRTVDGRFYRVAVENKSVP